MTSDKKTTLAITFATTILFISLVILIIYLIPKINELKLISDQVNSKKIEYQVGKLKVDNVLQLNEMISQYKQEADALGMALPNSPKAEDALVELSGLAKNANLQVISAEVQSDAKGSLVVGFGTKGTFENQVVFMDKLKTNIRPVRVQDISMTKADKDIVASFSLNLPYFVKNNQVNQPISEVK